MLILLEQAPVKSPTSFSYDGGDEKRRHRFPNFY
jgi:hypothetical protein